MPSDNKARPLLPRAAPQDTSTTPAADSTSTQSASRGSNFPSSRTNIRSACLACRRRRSRCTGGTPCSRCRALDTESLYNESQDGRTRALRDRGREELELHKKVVNGVFRAVRENREQILLDLIRNKSSLETIAAAIDDSNIDTRSESASETADVSSQYFTDQAEDKPLSISPMNTDKILQARHSNPSVDPNSMLDGMSWQISTEVSHEDDALNDSQISMDESQMPEHRFMLRPLHSRDHSDLHRLSRLYLNFRNAAKQMIAQGIPAASILGTTTISCDMLFSRQQPPFGVATWAAAIVNSVSGVDILFRLAWLCYITRFMRWAVEGTSVSFDLMPQAMKPTTLQLQYPHTAFIDLVPLPQIRDQMILNFRDFTTALEMAGASVHWTESIDDAIDRDPLTGQMTVSAKFENHISNIDNFCFGRRLLDIFPELAGDLQIAEVDQIASTTSAGTSPDGTPVALDGMRTS